MSPFLLVLLIVILLVCAFVGRGKSAPLDPALRPSPAQLEPFEEGQTEPLWRDDAHRSEF